MDWKGKLLWVKLLKVKRLEAKETERGGTESEVNICLFQNEKQTEWKGDETKAWNIHDKHKKAILFFEFILNPQFIDYYSTWMMLFSSLLSGIETLYVLLCTISRGEARSRKVCPVFLLIEFSSQ